jgi:hypothetical protein
MPEVGEKCYAISWRRGARQAWATGAARGALGDWETNNKAKFARSTHVLQAQQGPHLLP